jgi:aromatic-L-amino-acid decarboxylase
MSEPPLKRRAGDAKRAGEAMRNREFATGDEKALLAEREGKTLTEEKRARGGGRVSPLEMSPEEFRRAGHETVDRIADFLASLPERPVAPGESAQQVREVLGTGGLPREGSPAGPLLGEAARLLFDHSVFNGHPRFWAYITSSAAPAGALADLLASAVNPNVGGGSLSPVATMIELQTISWIAEMIGYPKDCGGVLVSGGNMANFVGFLAARRARAGGDVERSGMASAPGRPRVYASEETHTWIHKAADLFGLGTDSIRWVPVDSSLRMDAAALRRLIAEDRSRRESPLLVVGTAGTVATGAIDPLEAIAAICREGGVWFHVDGAYGGFAAALPEAPADLRALSLADSVAVDPHKWLYAPLEAGCALVRDPGALRAAFSHRPSYYHFDEDSEDAFPNFHERGLQNSRGFRALKVWLGLRQAGLEGYRRMIRDDIRLSEELSRRVSSTPGLKLFTQSLSITTFRYEPPDLAAGSPETEEYLNELNTELLTRLQNGGRAYLSNAVIGGKFLLRACIVNFRTDLPDIEALPSLVVELGRQADSELRLPPNAS